MPTDTQYHTIMIPIDGNLERELHRLHEEGWTCVPGTIPVAIYALQRDPEKPLQVVMGIDDSGVSIIKAEDRVN